MSVGPDAAEGHTQLGGSTNSQWDAGDGTADSPEPEQGHFHEYKGTGSTDATLERAPTLRGRWPSLPGRRVR